MKNDSIVVVKVESENEKINVNVAKALEKTKGFWKAAVVNNKRVSAFLDLVFEEQKDLKKNVPRANQLYEKGVKYYQKKQYEKAIEAFSESLVLYPNRDVYFDRAAVYLEKGENEKACLDWKILQDKGDKEAESLIKLYCK